jgi:putative SOS response-associated peptidase YedK
MCGRFVQTASPELLVDQFHVDEVQTEAHEPSYNVAPRASIYAVRDRIVGVDDDGGRDEHERRRYLSELRWGLIPSWAKDPKMGDRMINARAESVAEKPAYRRAFERHRCLVPMEGFYEWQGRGAGRRKQPMFVHRRDGQRLAVAGLWSAWKDRAEPDADWLRTAVIITTDGNEMMRPIHDRMPVVLEERDWEQWLDPEAKDLDALQALLVPAAEDVLVAYPVGPLVNKPDNDGPELVERVDPESDSGEIPSLL